MHSIQGESAVRCQPSLSSNKPSTNESESWAEWARAKAKEAAVKGALGEDFVNVIQSGVKNLQLFPEPGPPRYKPLYIWIMDLDEINFKLFILNIVIPLIHIYGNMLAENDDEFEPFAKIILHEQFWSDPPLPSSGEIDAIKIDIPRLKRVPNIFFDSQRRHYSNMPDTTSSVARLVNNLLERSATALSSAQQLRIEINNGKTSVKAGIEDSLSLD
jgi:hypothetical protein